MKVEVAHFSSARGVRIFNDGDDKYLAAKDILAIVDKVKAHNPGYYAKKIDEKWLKKFRGATGTGVWTINIRGVADFLKLFDTPRTQSFTRWLIEAVIPSYIKPVSHVEKAVQEVVVAEVVSEKTETSVTEFIFPVTQAKIRTITKDGEPWFVANEVAEILGYTNPQKAIRDHCKYVKLFSKNESFTLTSNPYGINLIPERDIYRLVMRSKLPAAEQFEEWVVGSVLPAIRKDGMYVIGEEKATTEESLEEMAIRVIQGLQDKLSRIMFEKKSLEGKTVELEKKAEVYSEKAGRYDIALSKDGGMIPSVAAKIHGIPPRKMIPFMVECDFVWKSQKQGVVAKQWALNKGYLRNVKTGIEIGFYERTDVVITPLGMDRLMTLWEKEVGKTDEMEKCAV